jgi:membrane-bound metal-dependent hydrolase YbcI (DUF457 family)
MDIFAHALWVGVGILAARRRWPTGPVTAAAAVGSGVLPDVLHMLPLAAWAVTGDGHFRDVLTYATASPANEPTLPPWVALWSHHLHCIMHSAVIASCAGLLLWMALRKSWRPRIWLPLAAWWFHIVIDVFTHSADFYPVSVFYPISMWGFNGIAWNTPWFEALNYCALALAWAGLWQTRSKNRLGA